MYLSNISIEKTTFAELKTHTNVLMNLQIERLKEIQIADYDYALPHEKIASYPLDNRDESKLLVYRNGDISETKFLNIDSVIEPNSHIVFNNTRVIPARLRFQKSTGATIEIFCLEPIEPKDYASSFQSKHCVWKCIVGNLKRWKNEDLVKEIVIADTTILFTAKLLSSSESHQTVEFTWNDTSKTFSEMIDIVGITPIPPYLNRNSEQIDTDRYQTVYSKIKGSVAAPTAGLHFTDNVFNKLNAIGVSRSEVTLHVGAGTFKPVQTDTIVEHEMHTEFFSVSREGLQELKMNYGRLIAVGTTTLRTLESLYWLGVKINEKRVGLDEIPTINQWDAYELSESMSYIESIDVLLRYMDEKKINDFFANTQILIAPGYKIKSVKALITNFHQPRSTLLLLVSAIVGDDWLKIYEFALGNDYRFLSYGDSSVLYT